MRRAFDMLAQELASQVFVSCQGSIEDRRMLQGHVALVRIFDDRHAPITIAQIVQSMAKLEQQRHTTGGKQRQSGLVENTSPLTTLPGTYCAPKLRTVPR